jgi:hypothetical protein
MTKEPFRDKTKAIIEDWPIWLSLCLTFSIGLIYQLQILDEVKVVPLAEYSWAYVFLLFITSLYYALPFVVVGFLSFARLKTIKEFTKEDLFVSVFLGNIFYGSLLILKFFFVQSFSFWPRYFLLACIVFIIFLVRISLESFGLAGSKKNVQYLLVNKGPTTIRELIEDYFWVIGISILSSGIVLKYQNTPNAVILAGIFILILWAIVKKRTKNLEQNKK